MLITNLILSTIFAVSSYVIPPNDRMTIEAKINYVNYERSNDVFSYCDNFVDMLYDNDYFNSETKITVLTHGMLGDASYWFTKKGDNRISFDEECLAYKILDNFNYQFYNLPIIKLETSIVQGEIRDVTCYQAKLGAYNYLSFNEVNFSNDEQTINLFKQHLVVVYSLNDQNNFERNGSDNEKMASFFRKSLNYFLSIYSAFNNNSLPHINLIGHSRGGILNLFYASRYEQIIDNFISIATPFNGSDWANVANSLNKLKKYNNPGELFTNYDGLLNNAQINQSLLNNLNDPFKICINCEMTPILFANQLITAIEERRMKDSRLVQDHGVFFDILELIRNAINNDDDFSDNSFITLANGVKDIAQSGINLIDAANNVTDVLSRLPFIGDDIENSTFIEKCILTKNFLRSITNLCTNIVNLDLYNGCIMGDFCVNSSSQAAITFGDNPFDQIITIPFGIDPYNDLLDKYLSKKDLGIKVVHNYESIYPAITSQITNFLIGRGSIDLNLDLNPLNQADINPYLIPCFLLSEGEIEQFYSCDLNFFDGEVAYRDYYYYEYEICRNESLMNYTISFDDSVIYSQRLRTGFIQNEKVVMSPNRENAGFAFIEFFFENPVHILTFDTSLWSQNEDIFNSEQKYAFSINEQFSNFIHGNFPYDDSLGMYDGTMGSLGRIALFQYDNSLNEYFSYIDIETLPENRQNPMKVCISSEEEFTYFGLYTVCNVTSFDRNKGRICISNFQIWY